MSLIKSHEHYTFETKLYHSEKVTLEPLEGKEEINDKQKIDYHYTYHLTNGRSLRIIITFMCLGEPKIERVNNLLKNIIKRIYKLSSINGHHFNKTTSQQYEQIIKDSINYTSFKHLYCARYAGQRDGSLLIHV